jgi:hypothetical protein
MNPTAIAPVILMITAASILFDRLSVLAKSQRIRLIVKPVIIKVRLAKETGVTFASIGIRICSDRIFNLYASVVASGLMGLTTNFGTSLIFGSLSYYLT